MSRRYGPADGDLLLYTHRDGAAAKAGHDLVLRVTRWEAELDPDGDRRLELTAYPDSIEVLEGRGGLKPLSDRDRREIPKTILSKVLRSDPIRFHAVGMEAQGADRYAVEGDLTVAGRTATVRWELELTADGHAVGEAVVTQSAFGIKPYTAFLGALKVSDDVEVRFSGNAVA